MIIDWICKKLIQRKNKKSHDCIKLQWKIAELESKLKEAQNFSK